MNLKRYTSCLIILLSFGVILFGLGRYFFSPRADLRHAVGLNRLPRSVYIEEWHRDAWTDYIFVAVVSISPHDVETLLAGRDFEKEDRSDLTIAMPPTTVFFLQDFETFEAWHWVASEPSSNGFYAQSLITINDSRDRLAIQFLAD